MRKVLISESQFNKFFLLEINDIHNINVLNDENCPYLDKVFSNGFTIREMLSYDDPYDRIDYASECLRCIGEGKRRTAFILDDNLILKLTNGSHTYQTQNEYNFAFNRSGDMDLMPRIIYQSSDFTWTIMERAEPLTEELCEDILGVELYRSNIRPSLQGFQIWAETMARQTSRQSDVKNRIVSNDRFSDYYRELVNTNPWFKSLYKLEMSQRGDLDFGTDLNPSGYDFRAENLGVVNRNGKETIVILDGGFLAPWGDVRKLQNKADKIKNRR